MNEHTKDNDSELKQILLSIVGNAPMGIITIDFNGLIVLINERAASILDISGNLNNSIDKPLTDFFEKKSSFYKILSKCIKEGRKEFNIENETYKEKVLSIKGRLFINGMLITIEDSSQAVAAQKQIANHNIQLERKNQELEQFAYIASHDLQEPLNTINSFSELVLSQDDKNIPLKISEYLKIINSATERMSGQIKGLLEYSRIGREKIRVEKDGKQIIEDVRINLSDQISKSNAEIRIGKIPVIKVYEEEFRSLFQNLISNSIKYSKIDTPPIIEIDSQDRGNDILFSIKDNGIGIPEEHFDRIFIIFQRLFNRQEYPGNGIGLSHCKKIAQLHGGDIWLESKLNKGTTFYFNINK